MSTLVLPSEILAVVEERKDGDIPYAYLLDSKASSARKKKARAYFKAHQEITIANSGFKIYLDKATEVSWRDFRVRVVVEHPGLEDLCKDGKVRTYIEIKELFSLIGMRGGNVQGFMIPGSYCIKGSGILWISPVLENMMDSKFIEAKQAGQIREGAMTSKWIPGHRYIMKNNKQVLYLGHVNSFVSASTSTTWSMCDPLSCMDETKYLTYYDPMEWGPGKLMILLDSSLVLDEIMESKGKNLTNAIIEQEWLLSKITPHFRSRFLFYRPDSSTKWVGSDMGEIWKLEPGMTEFSIGSFIEDYAISILGSFKGKYNDLLEIPVEYRSLINFVAGKFIPDWKDSWIKLEQEKWWRNNKYIFQKGSYSYYGRKNDVRDYTFENLKALVNDPDSRGQQPSFSEKGLPFLPLTDEEKDKIIMNIFKNHRP